MCFEKVHVLGQYMAKRMCTNFTNKNFNSEPYDERHEEFNKRGLNMFNIRSIDDFKKAFLLVDEYMAVKKTCFSDIDIKLPENESDPKLPNYQNYVQKMRLHMRKYSYLDNPYKERTLHSLRSNEPLNPQLLHLVEIATKQKNENILNVMRFNDFDSGFKSRSAIDVVNANAEYNLDTNHELHAKILIECIDDLEDREVIRNFYLAHRDDADFVDETFVDGLVQGRVSFLK